MVHKSHNSLPSKIDVRNPMFQQQFHVWAREAQCEILEVVTNAKKEIKTSKALIAEVNHMLARR